MNTFTQFFDENPFDVLEHDEETSVMDIEQEKTIEIFKLILKFNDLPADSLFCFTPEMQHIAVPKILLLAFEPILQRRLLVDDVVSVIMEYALSTQDEQCMFLCHTGSDTSYYPRRICTIPDYCINDFDYGDEMPIPTYCGYKCDGHPLFKCACGGYCLECTSGLMAIHLSQDRKCRCGWGAKCRCFDCLKYHYDSCDEEDYGY